MMLETLDLPGLAILQTIPGMNTHLASVILAGIGDVRLDI
jgi:hypothetical protein